MESYSFKNPELLTRALTHSSYTNERHDCPCNERLEFLGDSVLGLLAAEYLFENFPKWPEGELTRARAAYVCEPSLFKAAQALGLGERLLLGKGEEATGGRARAAVLADAFEAVLAAMYLDGGLEPCRRLVREYVMNRPPEGMQDAKTQLQERVQATGGESPCYRLISECGPDHDKVFTSEVLVGGKRAGVGEGRSKKSAEQAAAAEALKNM